MFITSTDRASDTHLSILRGSELTLQNEFCSVLLMVVLQVFILRGHTAKSRKSVSFIEGYTDLANLLQGFTLQDCSNACMLAFSVAVFQLLDHVQSVVVIIIVILCGFILFFPGLIQS
jgi:hypothetical protein